MWVLISGVERSVVKLGNKLVASRFPIPIELTKCAFCHTCKDRLDSNYQL